MRLAILIGFAWINSAAAAIVTGPFLDLRETIPIPDNTIVIEVDLKTVYYVPAGLDTYKPPIRKEDRIHFTITIDLPGLTSVSVKGLAYETHDTPDFSGNVVITTIYGLDPDPLGSGLAITGIELTSVPIEFSDETFRGINNTLFYGVSLGTPTLADLPVLFPDFDLSPFQGDPNSVVYVFQTTGPNSVLSIPETSTLPLASILASGFGWMRCVRWRRIVRLES